LIDWTKLQIISTAPCKPTNTGTLHLPKKGPEGYRYIKLLKLGEQFYPRNETVLILTLCNTYEVCCSSVTCDYVSYLASEIGLQSVWV
jgi:hypothetical protein